MGVKISDSIENMNKSERYAGNISGQAMFTFDLCESKTMADAGKFIKKISVSVPLNDVLSKIGYEALKVKYSSVDFVDVLEEGQSDA